MHAPQDVFVLNDKSPVVPDILRSADESVVKVSLADTAVRLTAVGEGVATIYATTADGKASGSCRVTVSKSSQGSHTFTDVSQSDYFYDAVMWCADEGLLDEAGNTVGVYTPCTRAEMVYHLWQLAGSPEPITSINAFSDLSSLSTQERKAIRWAVEENITNGTSITTGTTATTFTPDRTCVRSEVFTFLYRYFN